MSKIVQLVASEAEDMDYRRFERFANDALELMKTHKRFTEIFDVADVALISGEPESFEVAIARIENNLPSMKQFDERMAQCKEEQKFFSRDELWEPREHEDAAWWINRNEVKRQVLLLVDSFPTANIPNLKAFLKSMIDVVHAESPHPIILEASFRKMRRTFKKVPTIADVLETIAATETEWRDYWDRAAYHESEERLFLKMQADLRGGLEIAKSKVSAVTSKDGQRVRHEKFGVGTVEEQDGNKLTVDFGGYTGRKMVLDSFVTPVEA